MERRRGGLLVAAVAVLVAVPIAVAGVRPGASTSEASPSGDSVAAASTATSPAPPEPTAATGPAATGLAAASAGATPDTTASASAIVPGSVNRSSLALRARYDASVTLRYDTRLMAVNARLTVVNTSGGSIDRLELNTIAARLGAMSLRSVTVDGKAVRATVDDQTIVVPLGGVLPAGGTVAVRVVYRATLRTALSGSSWMFTRANGIIDAYRWLPWVSRRTPFDRPNHGDPFVTPVSPEVRVRITTDRPMVIASTGDRVSASGLTQTFVARNVRDFTITASPSYRTASYVVGNTTVRAYYRPGAPASAMLAAARRALARYNALLGSYPYRVFKVVQSAGGYGMESPALIWMPTGVATSNLTYLVYHETAHQWFYGLVGSDQAREPFADEAATDFVARYALAMRRASRCATARLDGSIYGYSATCYYEVVYIQGGNFLDDLRRRMGATAFWRGLRGYVADHRYGLSGTRTLLNTLDAATPLNLVPRYEPRFPRYY